MSAAPRSPESDPAGKDGVQGQVDFSDLSGSLSRNELTERFFTSLGRIGLNDDLDVIGAFALASELHVNQSHPGGPFVNHLLKVSTKAMDHLGVDDKSIITASLLKSVLEDRAFALAKRGSKTKHFTDQAEGRSVAAEVLENWYGPEVTEIVIQLTKPVVPRHSYADRILIYDEHTKFLVENYPKARVISLASFLVDFDGYDEGLKPGHRYRRDLEGVDLFKVHRDGLFLPDSVITGETRDSVSKMLVQQEVAARNRLSSKKQDEIGEYGRE